MEVGKKEKGGWLFQKTKMPSPFKRKQAFFN
jgi:hypothetical protein